MSEDPRERTAKYVRLLEAVLPSVKVNARMELNPIRVGRARDAIADYLKDAKYYLTQNRPSTALASVAYAEGLLDCLAMLEIVNVPGGKFSPAD